MTIMDTLDFQPMLITELFNLHNGLGASKKSTGPVPYVAASFHNNGIVGYVEKEMYPGGWLSFVKDGDGGAGTCFFQPRPFWPSNHVFALEPKTDRATESSLLVLASIITHQCFPKYSRGFAANAKRLSRQHIMVPVLTDQNGAHSVDWDGLAKLGDELLRYTATNIRPTLTATLCGDLQAAELNFQPTFITDVFDTVKASKASYDKTKLSTKGHELLPFVSRTRANNGVDSFCRRQEKEPEPGNAITIGLDTQTIGYQPVPFYTSQNIQVLRHKNLDEYSALVLAALIDQQMGKFSWGGNGATLGRLKKTRIMVPIKVDNHGVEVVDWSGMSRYGQALRAQTEQSTTTILDLLP